MLSFHFIRSVHKLLSTAELLDSTVGRVRFDTLSRDLMHVLFNCAATRWQAHEIMRYTNCDRPSSSLPLLSSAI